MGIKTKVHKIRICKGAMGRENDINDVLGMFLCVERMVKEETGLIWEKEAGLFKEKGVIRYGK